MDVVTFSIKFRLVFVLFSFPRRWSKYLAIPWWDTNMDRKKVLRIVKKILMKISISYAAYVKYNV